MPGSFAIGAVAGLASDPVSLGFVAETERQVERHLDSHLEQLPAEDQRSRDILAPMRDDEQAHGEHGARSQAQSLCPLRFERLMHATAKVMTDHGALDLIRSHDLQSFAAICCL